MCRCNLLLLNMTSNDRPSETEDKDVQTEDDKVQTEDKGLQTVIPPQIDE